MSTDQTSDIKIKVANVETQTTTAYYAIRAVARALSINQRYIKHYIYSN